MDPSPLVSTVRKILRSMSSAFFRAVKIAIAQVSQLLKAHGIRSECMLTMVDSLEPLL